MKTFALFVCLALAGCGAALKIPDKVSVAAATSCIDEAAAVKIAQACPPIRPDAELLELDDYKVVQALRFDRLVAAECMKAQGAAVQVCSKVPASAVSSPPPGGGRRE